MSQTFGGGQMNRSRTSPATGPPAAPRVLGWRLIASACRRLTWRSRRSPPWYPPCSGTDPPCGGTGPLTGGSGCRGTDYRPAVVAPDHRPGVVATRLILNGPPVQPYPLWRVARLNPFLCRVVVPLTKRLPIRAVPKQRLIAFVRADVIDHGCGRHEPGILAHAAERVTPQEAAPRLIPSRVVATLTSGWPGWL
jgi:hypothetical protein